MNERSSQAKIFEKFLQPHMTLLYRTAYRLTGNRSAAEDLVQETLLKLYPKTYEMQAVKLPVPWLKKVLYRQFVDELRKSARRPEHHRFEHPDGIDALQHPGNNPEKLTEISEIREALLEALNRLDKSSRLIVVMHLVEGYTLAEMAEIHNVPAETIKTRLRRAKARLKKYLRM